MMALPYDLYIRYLATTGLDDLKAVNEKLKEVRLSPITQEDLDRSWAILHNVLSKALINQIESKIYGIDFIQNMNAVEVGELWFDVPGKIKTSDNKTAMKLLFDIHEDISLRTTLNALLIKALKIEEITRLLSAKFSLNLKETHLDLYSRFFFNPKRMTRGDWKSYLKICTANEKYIYFKALTESAEVLKTELDLPSTISVSETIQWLLTKSFQKAKTHMNSPTPGSDTEARAWIDKVVQLSDKYEKYRAADQQDFGKVLQLEFDFIDDTFETPDDGMIAQAKTHDGSEKTT